MLREFGFNFGFDFSALDATARLEFRLVATRLVAATVFRKFLPETVWPCLDCVQAVIIERPPITDGIIRLRLLWHVRVLFHQFAELFIHLDVLRHEFARRLWPRIQVRVEIIRLDARISAFGE